jgi:hypothetical protein
MFIKLIFAVCLLMASLPVVAQDDDTIQFIHCLPETGEDTAQQTAHEGALPSGHVVAVTVQQVPQPLYNALDKEKMFKGWRSQEILFDKDSKLYWINFIDGNIRRSYAFDAKGHIVTLREVTLPDK